jgi:hypothetical protein
MPAGQLYTPNERDPYCNPMLTNVGLGKHVATFGYAGSEELDHYHYAQNRNEWVSNLTKSLAHDDAQSLAFITTSTLTSFCGRAF